ncbi:hypothetical protein DE146DRAFT_762503 [Phaeosphaeria sp. MPI-PUGE-AT-0046c]|nr:hypothetical protein DE146DRAFT_762503 [Phaeosphaeria sp. MPI-PUGE-AT-0046c]
MHGLSLALSLFVLVPVALGQVCYLPNGSPLPSIGTFFPAFAPCTSGGPSTVCCATNRTGEPGGDVKNGEVKDECLPNGLCQNRRVRNGVEGSAFFANFCTDPSYPSSKCLDICASSRGTGGNARVTPCTGKADSETWCCGESKDCCASGINVIQLAKVLGQALPSPSPSTLRSSVIISSITSAISSGISSIPSSSASASSTSSADWTALSGSKQGTKRKKKGLKGGAIAGIAIGGLAVLLLIAALLVVRKRRSKARSNALLANGDAVPPPRYDTVEHRVEKDARCLVELEAPMTELPGSEAKGTGGSQPHAKGAELDGGTVKRHM